MMLFVDLIDLSTAEIRVIWKLYIYLSYLSFLIIHSSQYSFAPLIHVCMQKNSPISHFMSMLPELWAIQLFQAL